MSNIRVVSSSEVVEQSFDDVLDGEIRKAKAAKPLIGFVAYGTGDGKIHYVAIPQHPAVAIAFIDRLYEQAHPREEPA